LLRIVVSFSLLALLFYWIDFGELVENFQEVHYVIIFIGISILAVQCALSSLKWKIILAADGISVPYLFLIKSYMIGNFISLFLPSSFGGDFYRIYILKKYNQDYLQNTSSVLFDRITGLFSLISISILSFLVFFKSIIDIWVLAVYLSAILSFWIMTTKWFLDFSGEFQSKLVQLPRKILISFSRYRNNGLILLGCLGISLLFHSNIVILNKLYAFALNIDVQLSYLYVVIPIVYLTEALPISINGLGVREGALVFFFNQAGFTNEQGLALGFVVIGMRYLFSISVGGSLFFIEFMKLRVQKSQHNIQSL